MITIDAHAKINLGLEILGRRSNGYHDVVTILQTIDLADRLTFVDAPDLTVRSSQPWLAADPNNLVRRAAQLLIEAVGVQRGARIYLEKNVPVAAGLGGGSSDAAATLAALNQLWETGLRKAELVDLARQLGADVGFFLLGGTQLATGLGDELEPLPTPALSVVVVPVPSPHPDKTRRLYAALQQEDWSDGRRVMDLAAALRAGESIHGRPLPSGFDRATRTLFPVVADALVAVHRAGGVPSLCGAGPSVISLHEDPDEARQVADRLRLSHQYPACLSTTFRSG